MAENSAIEWTHHTFNPWRGCTKVSPGCANCYAERQSKRNPNVLGIWGDGGTRVVASDSYWREPLKWNRAAEQAWERHRVFCASMADVFEDRPELRMPRARLWQLITLTPYLDWLLLTKRPENAMAWCCRWADLDGESCEPKMVRGPELTRACHPSGRGQIFADMLESMGEPPPGCAFPTFDWMEGPRWWGPVLRNVWIGTSVENQETADERIPKLLACPAAVRFLSIEPLLGPVDLSPWTDFIDWVIVGGESGPKARPMHPDWARSIRDECRAAKVPFFFKQWGEWQDGSAGGAPQAAVLTNGRYAFPWTRESAAAIDRDLRGKWGAFHPTAMTKVGKKAAGRLLDGVEHNAFPHTRKESECLS